MTFFRIFEHLLPRAKAWSLSGEKNLRSFFIGLSDAPEKIKEFADSVWLNRRPQTTSVLDEHELDYGLQNTGITEQQRRDRLESRIKAFGGQSPRYIQDTLRGEGFDVYVHEWFDGATVRNPLLYLRRSQNEVTYLNECGEPLAACGEPTAECGETFEPVGYPLVNRYRFTKEDTRSLCGEPLMECGEPTAVCGNYLELETQDREYSVPIQPDTFRYYIYIGGENFPDLATVDAKRKEEFEALCLKICPLQLWLGMLINYS